ncbi:MAG: hypothetical protein J6T62_03595 [Fibrobacter sp.]|nr:hypothetical protein [Fibrobacter sp.]
MAENIDSLTGVQDVSAFTYVVRDLPTQHLIDSLTYYIKVVSCENQLETCKNATLSKENDYFKTLSSEIDTLRKEHKQCQENYNALNSRIDFYKNNKMTPKELKDSITKLNGDITKLNGEIKVLNKKIDGLRSDSINLLLQRIDDLRKDSIKPLLEVQSNCKKNHGLDHMVTNFFKNDEYVFSFFGVLLVLIIAITIVVLKRGLTFSKGNTSICLGEKKRTRTKKAD